MKKYLPGVYFIFGYTAWHVGPESPSVQFSHSVISKCNPMDCSMPGFPLLHQLPELVPLPGIEPMHPAVEM